MKKISVILAVLMLFSAGIDAKVRKHATKKATTTKQSKAKKSSSHAVLGSDGQHEWVDLGLPSGTLWATMNVGAGKPEDYGDYFAWGETRPKSVYDWGTYKWGYLDSDNNLFFSKYNTSSLYGAVDNKTELDPEDDAATANWGSGWRMPSFEQIEELVDNCPGKWTTWNGVEGWLFKSKKNGASLFLPAAGYRYEGRLYDAGKSGDYWSRALDVEYPNDAYGLYFLSDLVGWYYYSRGNGRSVRAVRVSQN